MTSTNSKTNKKNLKNSNSIRIDGKVGNDIINEYLNKAKEMRKNDPLNYKGQVSGVGSYMSDPGFTMELISNRSFLNDSPESLRPTFTTESVTGNISISDPTKIDRKKYLEEVLNISTKEADEYFETRFKEDGVLRNFGKLMSDRFKGALTWKRAFDPRLPIINVPSARYRARATFWGYYNKGCIWGDPYGYGEPDWYRTQNDSVYVAETESLYNSEYQKEGKEEPNYFNYHFNLGNGFGESQVFNPPFQYNELDDPRTHPRYTKLGRVWVKRVLNNMPVMMVMPGKIKYHTNALTLWGIDFGAAKSNADYLRADNWFTSLVSAAWMGITDVVGTVAAFATAIFTGGRLVSFRQQINLFQKYFDNTATTLANNMGLISPSGIYAGRWKILSLTHIQPGIGLQRSGFGGWFGKGWRANQMIAFMMTKSVSCSETISNSTRDNPLMEEINAEASNAQAEEQTQANRITSSFKQLANFAMTGDLSQLAGMGKWFAVKAGAFVSQMALIKSGAARLTLPEVWDSSSFSRSYNFTFDCYAPYGNPLCKFETWGIQLAFWLTASLPRQVGSFSYIEPFVLRCVMPGKFNINYGIIENLSIERGEDINDWSNTDNLPRTVKISVSIKDYQPSIMLPQASRSLIKLGYEALFPATGFAEYMGTVAGLSLADQMDWKRRFGRAFRVWTSGWRRRTNSDILVKSLFNIGIVDRIGSIFKPYGNLFDKIEVLQDKAYLQEYKNSGIKALKDGVVRAATGTDTGAFFFYPIREIYRIAYNSGGIAKLVSGFSKAFGRIFAPKDTTDGWDVQNEMKNIDENNLFKNKGNVDSLNTGDNESEE